MSASRPSLVEADGFIQGLRLPSRSSASNRSTSHAIAPGWSDTTRPLVTRVLRSGRGGAARGLAASSPCLRLEMRAPQQGHEFFAAVRLRGRACQEAQQGRSFLLVR